MCIGKETGDGVERRERKRPE